MTDRKAIIAWRQRHFVTATMSSSTTCEVELLLGPYRTGKTTHLIEQLIEFKAENQFASTLIIVPSARYRRILKEKIGTLIKSQTTKGSHTCQSKAGIFGLEIQPFYHCCLKILGQTGKIPQVIPEEIRPALVTRLLSEMKAAGQLGTLANIAKFQGTASSVLDLIDELQRAGLSPDDVIQRLEQSSCQESHLLELARLYRLYWHRLKSLGFYDQKSLALQAREHLLGESHKQYDLVLIDGFDRISHLQAQVFAGIARQAKLTRIAFDYTNEAAEQLESRSVASLPAQHEEEFSQTPHTVSRETLKQSVHDYAWKEGSYNELLQNLNPRQIWQNRRLSPTELWFNNYAAAAEVPTIDFEQKALHKLPGSTKNNEAAKVVTSAIRLEAVSLLDPYMEMMEVVRRIKAAITHRKVALSDLVVVIRSPEAYSGAIETAFEEAGIAYFIDGSSKVRELEPWRFIRNIFLLAENEFKRKNVIDMLRSPFINLEALSIGPREVSLLDRKSYEKKVVGGLSAWQEFLSDPEFVSFAPALNAFFDALGAASELAETSIHARWLEDLIDKYMVLPSSGNDLRSALACTERETIKALRRALKLLMVQDELLQQEPEPFPQFFKRLLALIDKANYARTRPQTPAVTICSAELLPNTLFREIYVCGLIEGEFPKHQSASGFLSADQVRLWQSFGIDIHNPRHEPGFERALFYSITERASERLFLSLPQFAGKTDETMPSFYLEELSEKNKLVCQRLTPFSEGLLKPISARESLAANLWINGLARTTKVASKESALKRQWQNLEQSLSALIARTEGSPENLFNGFLSDFFESGALNFPQKLVWTASKINDYGKCPFRFWAQHILSLEPREEPEAGLNFALIGQFYHKVLEFFFATRASQAKNAAIEAHENPGSLMQNAKHRPEAFENGVEFEFSDLENAIAEENPSAPQRPATQPELSPHHAYIEEAFKRGIAWLEARSDFHPGPYWEQEKKDLRFRIGRFIEKEIARLLNGDLPYEPTLFEANFGTKAANSFPPLILKGNDGKDIVLRGSIDRVDFVAGSNNARIIDYKSGSRSISVKEAERGRNLQLPIYALALENAIRPTSSVNEADYLSISVARTVGHLEFNSEKHAHLKAQAINFIREYTDAANRGVFSVKPNGKDVCKDCQHKAVCRVAELKAHTLPEDADATID